MKMQEPEYVQLTLDEAIEDAEAAPKPKPAATVQPKRKSSVRVRSNFFG